MLYINKANERILVEDERIFIENENGEFSQVEVREHSQKDGVNFYSTNDVCNRFELVQTSNKLLKFGRLSSHSLWEQDYEVFSLADESPENIQKVELTDWKIDRLYEYEKGDLIVVLQNRKDTKAEARLIFLSQGDFLEATGVKKSYFGVGDYIVRSDLGTLFSPQPGTASARFDHENLEWDAFRSAYRGDQVEYAFEKQKAVEKLLKEKELL